MKKLEELGISPAPWRFRCETEEYPTVWCSANYHVATQKYLMDQDREVPDARLIAAAPELYEALHEAVIEMCHNCLSCKGKRNADECRLKEKDGKCFVQKWRKVLAKASGEETK